MQVDEKQTTVIAGNAMSTKVMAELANNPLHTHYILEGPHGMFPEEPTAGDTAVFTYTFKPKGWIQSKVEVIGSNK